MSDEWARFGLDLHLGLDRGHGLRAGLERELRAAVRQGRLPAGTPLPSSRALAQELGVARGTVTQVYEQLAAEGYLQARPRSGIAVAPQPGPVPAGPGPVSEPFLPPVPGADLRPSMPDLSLFPRREWLAATRQVLQTAPATAFGYGHPAGSPELRETLAEYLGRARGVVTTPGQLLICAGYTHALQILYQALQHATPAAAIAFEDPTLPCYPAQAERAGLRPRRIAVDADGLRVDQLTSEAAVVVTPAHQYPLGVTLSPGRRSQLLAWAQRTGALVIEDDYDGEFRYDRQPVGALQGMAPGHVVYAGTLSKSVAPGLRMAWLAVPAQLIPALAETLRWAESHVSVLDQLTLAQLIRSGELDRHLRRCRTQYRRRRDQLGAAVASELPQARLSGLAAGMHAVVHLPGSAADEPRLLAHLGEHKVAVDGLSSYYHRPGRAPLGIVTGYTTPPQHAFRSSLTALITALRSYRAGSPD